MPDRLDPPDRLKLPEAFWAGTRQLGLAAPDVARLADLPPATFRPGTTVTIRQYFALWRALGQLSQEPAPGIAFARGIGAAQLPPAFIAAYHARDLRDALARVARYKHLCSPETLQVTEEGEACTITSQWPQAEVQDAPEVLVDATFASLVELGRRGTQVDLRPLRVELARPADRTGTHRTYFGGPVRFRAEADRLILRRKDLDLPFASHNAELLEMLAPQLDRALEAQRIALSASERVVRLLRRLVSGGHPEIGMVARELGMSARTLQRRITEEGASFRQLLAQARRELAREYLADPALELKEVVFLLGYEDAPSFYRAFRQWEGTTPAHWRAGLAH